MVSLSSLTEDPQYGFTASADATPIGPKFVRITDLQDGQINWKDVPYCECPEPTKYLLKAGDILFARTGATTGKTHFVEFDADAIFASYLIRVRPRSSVRADYLYSFFQSDSYWSQIISEKEGSAQPNVNGRKLMTIILPSPDAVLQGQIVEFLKAVRTRQDGLQVDLPLLSPPFHEQRRIVERIESLSAKLGVIDRLVDEVQEESDSVVPSALSGAFDYTPGCELPKDWRWLDLSEVLHPDGCGMMTGPFGTLLQKSDIQTEGIPVLGIANVQVNRFFPGFRDFVTPAKAEALQAYALEPGDIVIARSGTVGRSCVLPEVAPRPVMSTNLIRLRLDRSVMAPRLLCMLFNGSRLIERHIDSECRGSTREFFTQKILSRLQLPVPPLHEQERKLQELERLEKDVEALKLRQSERQREVAALRLSIVNHAFSSQL